MKNPARFLVRHFNSKKSLVQIDDARRAGLPDCLAEALECLVRNKFPAEIEAIADGVEAQRKRLIKQGNTPVEVLYSPRPGSAGEVADDTLRPEHGDPLQITMERAANTGKKRRWASALAMLAHGRGMELGACAGISGAYLGSVLDHFTTIEGSPSLAAVAQEVIGDRGTVMTGLFDEVLDSFLPTTEPLDFLFIDGHHEKVATIHYWMRCRPKLAEGAIVIFDDISWSQDMRDCWDEVRTLPWFSHCIDVGKIGIAVHSEGATPRQWNFREAVEPAYVGKPWGWADR